MSLPRQILPNKTYLLTRRCLGRRYLLRPDKRLNNLFVYCLTLAAQKYGIQIHAFTVMSNHYHIVLTDVDGVLPLFVAWLNRHLAMCIKRLRRWDEVVWEPNVAYNSMVLTDQAEVLDKIGYTLLNPVSACLVRTPKEWPGAVTTLNTLEQGSVHSTRPAVWFKDTSPAELTLELTTPPCIPNKPAFLNALDSLLTDRQKQLRDEHEKAGRGYRGEQRVVKTRVTSSPKTKKQRFGRNPTFSALTRAAWRKAVKELRAFRLAYRLAYQAWRDGDTDVEFPLGTWWLTRYACATSVT